MDEEAETGSEVLVESNESYDSLDRPVKTSNPYYVNFSGSYSTADNSVAGFNYTYDQLDRVIQVLNPDNTRIKINFTLWNVSTLDERGKRKDYILDGNGNIIRVVEFYNNGTNIITYNTTYRYDALNQLTQINDSKANQFNFTYDSLGRTIRLQDPDLRTWNYTYDSVGNLIAQEGAGGELMTDGEFYREYNALHQLIRVRQKTSTGKIVEEYWYGPDGERIKTLNRLTNTTIYTPFKEWMMIVNRTGTYNYTYVYDGNTLIARLNPDGTKWFYHDDHLGSTSLITDENGTIVEETFYNPFGQVTSGGEREAYLLYTNQMKDAIGCYDYGARVYCPEWYHFTSGDPITANVFDPQGLNRFAYVRNNPYKYVDPDGENPVAIGVAIWVSVNARLGAIEGVFSETYKQVVTEKRSFSDIDVGAIGNSYVSGAAEGTTRGLASAAVVASFVYTGNPVYASEAGLLTHELLGYYFFDNSFEIKVFEEKPYPNPKEDQEKEVEGATTIVVVYDKFTSDDYTEDTTSDIGDDHAQQRSSSPSKPNNSKSSAYGTNSNQQGITGVTVLGSSKEGDPSGLNSIARSGSWKKVGGKKKG